MDNTLTARLRELLVAGHLGQARAVVEALATEEAEAAFADALDPDTLNLLTEATPSGAPYQTLLEVVVPILEDRLASPVDRRRYAAMMGLWEVESTGSIPLLKERLEVERNADCRATLDRILRILRRVSADQPGGWGDE